VKPFTVIALAIVLLSGTAALYVGHKRLERMEVRMSQLNRQMADTTRLVKEESAAVNAANQRATEAAWRAELAAGGRAEAEQQKQLAEAGRAQAESVARQANEEAAQARTDLDSLRKQREQELNQMQEALNRVVETRRTPNGIVVVLPDSVFKFDFDSADLRPKNRELLSRIAGILLVSKGYGLSVFGYTDDVGTEQYNQRLSERRAVSVRGYLVQAGIDPSIINTKGFGKTNPLVPEQSEDARARNRRVEIALTDSEIKYVGEVGTTH
jgi:outer membrane protein OmpA-like peptidoglycan-associated protein